MGDLIRDCPEELQVDIMKNFDPSGTKDRVGQRSKFWIGRTSVAKKTQPEVKFHTDSTPFYSSFGLNATAFASSCEAPVLTDISGRQLVSQTAELCHPALAFTKWLGLQGTGR